MILFVDTGAFYAAADRSDARHEEAALVFRSRAASGDLVTTDHVMVETWLLLRARLGRPASLQFWDSMTTGVVRVLGVDGEAFQRAREIARDWPDQEFSLVDCTSFATIEAHRIREAFAFDRHFRVFRLGRDRRRALTVIP